MKTIQNLVIDMDGVLWHGDRAIAGLQTFFHTLNTLNLPFVLATNNAMKVATQYTDKLTKFGVQVAAENILTSSEASASYLKHSYPDVTTVYAIGENGLHMALQNQGFDILKPEDVRAGKTADIVVAGLTKDSLNYELLAMGSLLIYKGAKFIATNYDSSFPSEIGPLPGAGAVLSVLEKSTGVNPLVIGKPNPAMFKEALRLLNADASVTAMVGDRLNTDIEGGKAAGMQTILVLSGVSSLEEANALDDKPDYIYKDITELTQKLLETHS